MEDFFPKKLYFQKKSEEIFKNLILIMRIDWLF